MLQLNHNYQQFQAGLSQTGLNLCAAFDSAALPDAIKTSLPPSAFEQASSILLVAAKGQQFWQHLQSSQQAQGHCFDSVSQKIVKACFVKYFPHLKTQQLYPNTQSLIPLQKLGQSIGWGQPSVLGLDIHPQHGTWFAYRCCLLVFGVLPVSQQARVSDVCRNCIDKPCQTACPAKAVKSVGEFNLRSCAEHRISDHSSCADCCLARRACPIGLEFAYSEEQLAHHSLHALASIKRYRENKELVK